MKQFRDKQVRLIFTALYALALSLVAYAHKPLVFDATANSVSPAELAAYALPDGSLPVLCLSGSPGGSSDGAVGATCDACLITSSPGLLVAPIDSVGCPSTDDAGPEFPLSSQTLSNAPERLQAPRAPPVSLKAIA
ncbi:hypothetical protein [uncultured Roseibium sp.]|uniref:hypothetical protein n=1 Tax=uncultured Roseibium sp. TaxID=1936171 RepID=UPI00321697B2